MLDFFADLLPRFPFPHTLFVFQRALRVLRHRLRAEDRSGKEPPLKAGIRGTLLLDGPKFHDIAIHIRGSGDWELSVSSLIDFYNGVLCASPVPSVGSPVPTDMAHQYSSTISTIYDNKSQDVRVILVKYCFLIFNHSSSTRSFNPTHTAHSTLSAVLGPITHIDFDGPQPRNNPPPRKVQGCVEVYLCAR